jgi:hypothetical protein
VKAGKRARRSEVMDILTGEWVKRKEGKRGGGKTNLRVFSRTETRVGVVSLIRVTSGGVFVRETMYRFL